MFISGSNDKIIKCNQLLRSGRVDSSTVPEIEHEIAAAYASLNNFDSAIEYQLRAARSALAYLNAEKKQGRFNQSLEPPTSYKFETLGNFQMLAASYALLNRNTDRGRSLVKAANSSFSQAVLIDRSNHSAFAHRGELLMEACRRSEGESDLHTAISIVQRLGDTDKVQQYQQIALTACHGDLKGIFER